MKPHMETIFFFTIAGHGQTYQLYEQSRQKLGTFLEIKNFKKILLKAGLLLQYF